MGQKLNIGEERFQSVMQAATDAIVLWDAQGIILSWNIGASTMFGYTSKEMVGNPLLPIISAPHKDSFHDVVQHVEILRQEQTPVKTVELVGVRKNGEEFPIEMSPSISILEDGTFYCGIMRDISSRKLAERSLEERNRLLALEAEVGDMLNRSQSLHALWQDCANALVRHLDAALAAIWILSFQKENLELQASAGLYTHVTNMHGPVPFGYQKIAQIAFEKKPYLTNTVIEDPGVPEQGWAKQEGLMSFTGYPLLNHHQQVLGVLSMYFKHPVTHFTWHSLGIIADRLAAAIESHRAMEAHQKLAKHNERILTSLREGIYGLAMDGKLTFVNPAGARMLGYRAEELLGEPMHELINHTKPDGTPYLREDSPLYNALSEGVVYRNDTERLWRKDGTSFPVDYSISPLVENGKRIGAVVTFQDITERLRLTAELLEETKLAGVSRMLGDISHDIKNMLMPVLNGAQLLDEELMDFYANLPDATTEQVVATRMFSRDAIDMIINNARRIQGRMREIADTVKGISSPLCFAPCQVSEVVKGVFEILRFYAAEKGIALRAQGLDDIPSIQADEHRLFNALYNLVNNAIPETPVGGSVTVTGAVESNGTIVVISVVDTGKGMPPEIRDRLFTKDAVSGKAGGTGLGTKIVKDVVDAHAGTVTVHSEQGKGTTFTIHIPVKHLGNLENKSHRSR